MVLYKLQVNDLKVTQKLLVKIAIRQLGFAHKTGQISSFLFTYDTTQGALINITVWSS